MDNLYHFRHEKVSDEIFIIPAANSLVARGKFEAFLAQKAKMTHVGWLMRAFVHTRYGIYVGIESQFLPAGVP